MSFSFTTKQQAARAILRTPATHILLDGGSRSGKTFLFVHSMVTRAIKAPGSRHAILRFRFNHVKQSIGLDTYPAVMRCFPQIHAPMNKSDWYARLPNDSEIWLGGLDDKDRTEKVLGTEYATIFFNECSQIPWASRNMAITRLAQKIQYELDGEKRMLALKAYYDCNPPTKAHWAYQLFHLQRDPETKRAVNVTDYATLQMNPSDNRDNLPTGYIAQLEGLSDRLQRRFLRGEYGEEAPGQLWTDEIIDRWRVLDGELPDLQRIVIAVDPSGADEDDAQEHDEIGIMVGGLGTDGRGYLLEDLTISGGPARWGKTATAAFDRHAADLIVGEVNYGGAMVKHVIQTARPRTPFKMVTASRGKVVRAEPIAALHEIGKIRMVGTFNRLEDELCAMTTHGYVGSKSPNRADAFVWLFSELFPGMERAEKAKPEPRRAAYAQGSGGWMN